MHVVDHDFVVDDDSANDVDVYAHVAVTQCVAIPGIGVHDDLHNPDDDLEFRSSC